MSEARDYMATACTEILRDVPNDGGNGTTARRVARWCLALLNDPRWADDARLVEDGE